MAARSSRVWAAAGALLAAAAGAGLAHAASLPSPGQTAPQTVKPSAAPPVATVLPPPVAAAPAGSEALRFRTGAIAVDGGLDALAPETQALTAQAQGRTMSVADLYALAGRIEAAYARRGFILARVAVPPQTLADGAAVRLTVIDGFIQTVAVDGVPVRARGAVRARTSRLINRHWLTLAQIERALVLAGEAPGVSLRSALTPGDAAGGVKLVVEGDYRPLTFGLAADNRLGHEFGDWEIEPQVSLNGLLGFGELVYASAFLHPGEHGLTSQSVRRVLGVGAVLPLGDNGLTLNPELTLAQTNPRQGAGALRTRGTFQRFVARISYPLIKSRREDLEISAGLEAIDERQTALDFGTQLSDDRLRNIVIGADWARAYANGVTVTANLLGTQGFNGLGARTDADVAATGTPFSRQGVEPIFSKIEGAGRLNWVFSDGWAVAVAGRFQANLSGPLAGSEQFNLDAPDGLSAFPVGRLSGDSGWTVRGEFAREVKAGGASLSPYLFAAAGQAFLDRPTALEQGKLNAQAYGAGLRFTLPRPRGVPAIYGALEVGRAVSDAPQPDATRLMVNLGLRF
jgi:hemolysin activation/secretion protein